jgi:uncharacterized protein (TIGR02001 family)
MRKTLLAVAIAGVFSLPAVVFAADAAPAAAPASPHTFTGNVGFASEYLYRGIAQTAGKPALQGGFDYAHASGLYAGVWGSNISWLENLGASGASLEIDIYGGYKGTFGASDFGYDVGVLTYNYPGSLQPGATNPDTTELYGALSWKFLTLKYSQSTSNLFGNRDSSNSSYLELNAAYDLGNGWGVNGHVGSQRIKNVLNSDGDYTDFKLGVTKDLGFGVVGLAVSATDAKDNCGVVTQDFYCFQQRPGGAFDYSAGKTKAVLTFNKTF